MVLRIKLILITFGGSVCVCVGGCINRASAGETDTSLLHQSLHCVCEAAELPNSPCSGVRVAVIDSLEEKKNSSKCL